LILYFISLPIKTCFFLLLPINMARLGSLFFLFFLFFLTHRALNYWDKRKSGSTDFLAILNGLAVQFSALNTIGELRELIGVTISHFFSEATGSLIVFKDENPGFLFSETVGSAVIPVRFREEVIGKLVLCSRSPQSTFTKTQLAFLNSLVDLFSVPLKNLLLISAIQEKFEDIKQNQSQLIESEKMQMLVQEREKNVRNLTDFVTEHIQKSLIQVSELLKKSNYEKILIECQSLRDFSRQYLLAEQRNFLGHGRDH